MLIVKISRKATRPNSAIVKNQAIAHENGLRYIESFDRGIRRIGKPKHFAFVTDAGRKVTDPDTLLRIKALVLPPAWKEVWISPYTNGHIQSVGLDARGRKQYRYHADWTAARDSDKYNKVLRFARALPGIRQAVRQDLRRKGLPREKVLAAVIATMEKTLIRVGNEEYAHKNHSYGLTTLHDEHAIIKGSKVHFDFRGKSGVQHSIDLEDPRLATIIRRCRDLPGEELFQYQGHDAQVHDVKSADVNDYLRQITGENFTAKDFRTWAGTFLAAQALQAFEAFDSQRQAKKNVLKAIESVAQKLGNTKTVCRRCYVHPSILDAYMDGDLIKNVATKARQALEHADTLSSEETVVLALLKRRLGKNRRRVA